MVNSSAQRIEVSDAHATSGSHSTSGSTATAPSGVRILVVDDDPRIRRGTAGTLSRVGFHVVTADDGGPAIAQAEITPPDLAIVDLEMPTNGYEVVRRLKALHGAACHVTVQSGRDDELARAAAFDAGADDFLTKPVSGAELRRRMIAAARSQQAYVELRLAREKLDRLLTYGAEANALLAHDLNNGLAVALSNITFLDEVLSLGEDETQALASTRRALARMSGLVANFVDIARFEDAAVKPRTALTLVKQTLVDAMEVHVPSLGRGIQSSIECDADLSGNFDASLIERVLHNLIGNASRYCNPNGHLRVSARRWDPNDPHSIEIAVQNSGAQIPEELRANLFGKYSKGANGKRGIGLYFCRLACEAHGGHIELVAHPDGPMFVIRLPGRA